MRRLTRMVLHATLGAAVLGGAVACSTSPTKTSEQRVVDNETADAVQTALASDKVIYARHITVRADSGVVHLGGFVWNPEDLYEAQRIAGTVPGVRGVVNEMELEREGLGNSPVTR